MATREQDSHPECEMCERDTPHEHCGLCDSPVTIPARNMVVTLVGAEEIKMCRPCRMWDERYHRQLIDGKRQLLGLPLREWAHTLPDHVPDIETREKPKPVKLQTEQQKEFAEEDEAGFALRQGASGLPKPGKTHGLQREW